MLRQCGHCGSWYDVDNPDRTASFGDLTLVYPRLLIASQKKTETQLTKVQSHLMQILMRGLLSTEAVMGNLFPNSENGSEVLRVHVSHLRTKLKAIGSRTQIENIKGLGYRLVYHVANEVVDHGEYVIPIDNYRSAHVRTKGRGAGRPRRVA
jgi:DNA-binding response OmpR family regulator